VIARKKKKLTEQEVQDELAAQELQGGGFKSQPSPVHSSMGDTEYDPDANATDAAPDDDGDFDEDRRP